METTFRKNGTKLILEIDAGI